MGGGQCMFKGSFSLISIHHCLSRGVGKGEGIRREGLEKEISRIS